MMNTINLPHPTRGDESHFHDSLWTEEAIQEKQKHLQQWGFIRLSLSPNSQWLALAQLITQKLPQNQQNGYLLDPVQGTKGKESLPDSAGLAPISAHTDLPHFRTPPKYLGLFCEQPDAIGDVFTLLGDTNELLHNNLTEDQQKLLMRPAVFMSKDRKHKIEAPILGFNRSEILFRYSENILLRGHPSPDLNVSCSLANPHLKEVCDFIATWFEDHAIKVRLTKGELLIFNNHQFIHGRTQVFDPNRRLQRVLLG